MEEHLEEKKEKFVREYSTVIVLPPKIVESKEGRLNYKEGIFEFRYSIKNDPYEFRYKAVSKLFHSGVVERFILPGGPVRKENNDQLASEGVEPLSPHIMKYTLVSKYGVAPDVLRVVSSAPHTIGNITAAYEELKNRDSVYLAKVGVLTNFYHLARALRLFAEHTAIRPIPICAESFLLSDEFERERVKKFYIESGLSYILENQELQGFLDIERGMYAPRTM